MQANPLHRSNEYPDSASMHEEQDANAPMTLQTPRLRIRDLTPADADGLFPIYSDPQVCQFIGGTPVQTLDEQCQNLAATLERQSKEPPGLGRWAIETLADHRLVGLVILKHAPDADRRPLPEIEVGWHLGRFAWGNGYATEATRALLDHAREPLKLPIVYAIIDPQNTRSIRVAERLNMKPLGLTSRFYGKQSLLFACEP